MILTSDSVKSDEVSIERIDGGYKLTIPQYGPYAAVVPVRGENLPKLAEAINKVLNTEVLNTEKKVEPKPKFREFF